MKGRFCARGYFAAAVILMWAASAAYSQEPPPSVAAEEPPLIGVIDGKICLPSGQSIGTNVKVTLANRQAPLLTLYSNQNGEFRFTELREGRYEIHISADPKLYMPMNKEVWIRRGTQITLTIYLELKRDSETTAQYAKTVSTAELNRAVSARAKKEYERASKLIKKSQIQEAIEHLKLAVRIAPEYLIARNDLGIQYLKTGLLEEAAEQFNAAIEKDPTYVDARLNLGLVLVEQRRYAEAADQLRQAITLDSSRPVGHLWLGIVLIETDHLPEAQRELFKARLLGGPQYALAHYYMAQIEMRHGARDHALRELEAYIEEAPKGEMAQAAQALAGKLRK